MLGNILNADHHSQTFTISTRAEILEGDSGSRVLIKYQDRFLDSGLVQTLVSSPPETPRYITRVSHFSSLYTRISFFDEKELNDKRFGSGYSTKRMVKPNVAVYRADGNSFHHVIPITYMSFIWDYFHLNYPYPERIMAEFKKEAVLNVEKQFWKNLENMDTKYKVREPKLRKDYTRRCPGATDHEITQFMRHEFRGRKKQYEKTFNKDKNKEIREEIGRLKEQYMNKLHDDILPILNQLCFSAVEPNKRWFSWSFANLFIGPGGYGDEDTDGRDDDEKNGYRIEPRKPKSFYEQQWAVLKSICCLVRKLISIRRNQLQKRNPAVIKIECTLKSELAALWDCTKYLQAPHPRHEYDWLPGRRNSYTLA